MSKNITVPILPESVADASVATWYVKVGDKVITAGGLHGTVANVKNKTIILKVHDGSKLEFEKSSVASTIPKGTETDEAPSSDAVVVDSPPSS